MSKAPTPNDPMVILSLAGGGVQFYVPLSQAVALMPAFAVAQRVEYSWSAKCFTFYKPSDSDTTVGIKVLTPAQIAQLHLESEAE